MDTVGRRILLVEDDRFLRRACEVALCRRGFAVTLAMDGHDGLQKALADPPDLVLLDMLMPKLSGLDVLRALKADDRTRTIPVLILSNSSRPDDMAEVMRLGATAYLVKANLSLAAVGDRVAHLLQVESPQ